MARTRGRVALGVGLGTAAAAFATRGFWVSRVRRRLAQAQRTKGLVKVGSTAGTNYAKLAVKSKFADEAKRVELREAFELQTAEQVAAVLGNMKGAVMKIGQMASYLDQGLPEPVRDALAQLQADAPPMSYSLVEEVIRDELGGDPQELFAEFSTAPLAAASIGQVHRAVTHDGQVVAVKVQYPGVDEAISADLDNSDMLFGAMSLVFSGMDPGPIVEELRSRITEELDYSREASFQQRFADYYRGHPTISVPDVRADLSTSRVLTTQFVEGHPWSEMVTWSQEERNLAAETMYRYAFGGIYRLGMFNGDPHPGNYLFHPGGKVTFLDYGLCKEFTAEEVGLFESMIRTMVIDHDMAEVRKVWTEIGILRDSDRFSDEELFDYFGHFFEQVMADEEMTITPEYASESVRRYFDISGPHADIIKSVTLPSFMVIIQRINLGLFALFGELNARGNWRRMAEEIWPIVSGEPSTPMGEAIRQWEIATGKAPTPTPTPTPEA
jgi:predicted unusual protein kinase regulating ubiquinone biosynthesis (AarF/ABC1/UbiB family)